MRCPEMQRTDYGGRSVYYWLFPCCIRFYGCTTSLLLGESLATLGEVNRRHEIQMSDTIGPWANVSSLEHVKILSNDDYALRQC